MSVLLQAALRYLGNGWSVIPLQPKGKKPAIPWTEYQERLPTEEEVRQWWKDLPDANVGIVTGRVSGMVVVDVDTYRGGDARRVHGEFATGLVSRTGSGGYHLFYRYPDNAEFIPNQVGSDGIDVRADGGLVVAPPSAHVTGKLYEWSVEGDPGDSPQRLLVEQDAGERIPEKGWVSGLLRGTSKGGRNDACARLAGYYAGKGIPKDILLQMLQSWNVNNDPPLSDREMSITVDSVYKTAYRRAQRKDRGLSTPAIMSNNKPNEKPGKFSLMGFQDYMSTYAESAVSWLVDKWLPDQTICFLVSPPGSYKTWLLCDLAVSIASGQPFLGHFPISEPGPVFLIQQEDFHGQIAERLAVVARSRLGLDFSDDNDEFTISAPPELPIYVHPDRRLRLDNKEILDSLEEQVAKIKPKLIMLDPLYSAGSTEDYMAKTAEQLFFFKLLRDKYKCTTVVAHHRKKSADNNEREGAWGSQFLNAFLETGWQVRPKSGDEIRVKRHFKSGSQVNDLDLKFSIRTDAEPYKYVVESQESSEDGDNGPDILEALIKNGTSPLNLAQIGLICGVHRSTASRKIRELEKDGFVRREGKGYVATETPEF